MKDDPEKYHRRSIRLKDYDYSQAGSYFVTICTYNRECLLGEITNGSIKLNDAGRMIKKWYLELIYKFPDIRCSEHVIMPNHFHCIIHNIGIIIVGADLRVCPDNTGQSHRIAPTNEKMGEHTGSALHRVVQWFKTMTTNEYIRYIKQNGWKPFNGKLWQRNYYEHVIRNDAELNGIREYIINNPFTWHEDIVENPDTKAQGLPVGRHGNK